MTETTNLLPCPFCGGVVEDVGGGAIWHPNRFRGDTPCPIEHIGITVKQWNTRARIDDHIKTGGWMPIETAPKNAKEILVRTQDKHGNVGVVVAHYADGGGEDQPPYKGWFMRNNYGFHEIAMKLLDWQPLPPLPKE